MLHDFLASHRDELIGRCQAKLLERQDRGAVPQLQYGIPLFLNQLIGTLKAERQSASKGPLLRTDIGTSASLHGKDMLTQGFSVDDVVHCYGDLCQAITDLAVESGTPFLATEFRTLNWCLDNAIAHAVSEFSYQHGFAAAGQHAVEADKRMDAFLDELRNLLGTASLAFAAAKSGGLSANGATGTILERSLQAINRLIDSAGSRIAASTSDVLGVFALAPFIDEVRGTAELAAQSHGCTLVVKPVDPGLAVKGSRDLLYAALVSLLQNAAEFTQVHTEISLVAYARAGRIQIDIADHCGGLPPGGASAILAQSEKDSRSGLGLPIARRFVAVSDGVLAVKDIPGVGCVMSISLPRYAVPT